MTTERDDDRLPDWLREAARGYHPPPPAPRDQMWRAITAERERRRARRRMVRWGLAMAATLVLGIGIGRMVSTGRPGPGAAPLAQVPAAAPAAYRVATAQYVARTEALLTDFRSERESGRLDPQFLASARDLLTTTRLMLDSPAANDPHLRILLQDLELVLAQIAQLGVEPGRAGELDLIDQGMIQHSVLPRLRSVSPAADAATRTQGVL